MVVPSMLVFVVVASMETPTEGLKWVHRSGRVSWDLLPLRAAFWILTSSTLGPCDHKGGVNGVTVKVGA